MKKNDLKIEQVRKLIRKSGISTLAEAYYVVFEVDGSITAITEENKDELSFGVINDGELIKGVIENTLKIDESWIHQEIERQGVALDEIVYAEYRLDGKLFIYTDHDFISEEDSGIDE